MNATFPAILGKNTGLGCLKQGEEESVLIDK